MLEKSNKDAIESLKLWFSELEKTGVKFSKTVLSDKPTNLSRLEIEIMKKFWNEKCTEQLKLVVFYLGEYGPYYFKMREAVGKNIYTKLIKTFEQAAKDPKQKLLSNKGNGLIHTTINIPLYYADFIARNSKMEHIYPVGHCFVCKKEFNMTQARFFRFRDMTKTFGYIIDFCPKCIEKTISGNTRDWVYVKDGISYIKNLVDLLGFIPNPNDYNIIYQLQKKSGVPRDKLRILFDMLHDNPSFFIICTALKREYGSWFRILIKAGVLDKEARQMSRGVMCIAKDGHECNSIAEKMVDDWLLSNKIQHNKEPYYPKEKVINPSGKLRGDWKVGNIFIEFFGLVGIPEYDKKIKLKENLCKTKKIQIISIYPDDLFDLSKKLKVLTK